MDNHGIALGVRRMSKGRFRIAVFVAVIGQNAALKPPDRPDQPNRLVVDKVLHGPTLDIGDSKMEAAIIRDHGMVPAARPNLPGESPRSLQHDHRRRTTTNKGKRASFHLPNQNGMDLKIMHQILLLRLPNRVQRRCN